MPVAGCFRDWCAAAKLSANYARRGCAMTRFLLSVIAILTLIAALLWWQVDRQAATITTVSSQLNMATARADSLRNTLRLQRELAADAADLDQRHTQALSDARAATARLAAAVATGERRSRVPAHCPSAGVPGTASTAGMDDGEAAELTPAARQDYFALRGQVIRTEAALAGLQEYVSRVCLHGEG